MSDDLKALGSTTPARAARAAGVKKRGKNSEMIGFSTAKAQADEAVLGQDIQSHLGRTLKASYEEMLREPVPDKFHELLKELERREKN